MPRPRHEIEPEHQAWLKQYLQDKQWPAEAELSAEQHKQMRAAYRQRKAWLKRMGHVKASVAIEISEKLKLIKNPARDTEVLLNEVAVLLGQQPYFAGHGSVSKPNSVNHIPPESDTRLLALKQSVIDSLPPGTGKRTINKVVSGLNKESELLKKEFNEFVQIAVEKGCASRLKSLKDREDKSKAIAEENLKMRAGIRAFMSLEEFNLIRSCLHPDKNASPVAAKAFKIFNKLVIIKQWADDIRRAGG